MRRELICRLVLLSALALVLASCGGGGSTGSARSEAEAERVTARWLEDMSAGDIGAACRLMNGANHAPDSDHADWSRAKSCRERWLHSDHTPLDRKPTRTAVTVWGERDPQVLEVALDGDHATVLVAGAGTRRPIWLTLERDRWRVAGAEYPI